MCTGTAKLASCEYVLQKQHDVCMFTAEASMLRGATYPLRCAAP